jgi:hypothetical protein
MARAGHRSSRGCVRLGGWNAVATRGARSRRLHEDEIRSPRRMLHVAFCVLHVARHLLHVAWCALHVACAMSHAARCMLQMVRHVSHAAYCACHHSCASHLASVASDALQMNGTLLPPMETGVVWTIGLEAEVTWQVLNNHGGGYSYRCRYIRPCSHGTGPGLLLTTSLA